MPKLGGEQLYHAVKQRHPTVKFLLTSGFSAADLYQRTSVGPAIPFLQKPWTVTELLWSVRDALDRDVGEPALEALGAGRV
jgi:DNA-binding NtrC family response regulator